MNITELPTEVQELIIVNVDENIKLNLVCFLWNEICKKKVIKLRRSNCICKISLYHVFECPSKIHQCICNLDKESIHYAFRCKAKTHPCICKNGTPNHVTTCRANKHMCVCNMGKHFRNRCKSSKHIVYL